MAKRYHQLLIRPCDIRGSTSHRLQIVIVFRAKAKAEVIGPDGYATFFSTDLKFFMRGNTLATQNDTELIRAINRNTRATRSIAIVLVGWIPGLLIGSVLATIGSVTAPFNPSAGGMTIVLGVLVIAVSAIIAIIMAWVELRHSSFNSGPESSPSTPMNSDGAPSIKSWLQE